MVKSISAAAVLFLAWSAGTAADVASSIWTLVAFDPKGDVREGAADAAQLAYRYDAAGDRLWLRIALYGRPDAATLAAKIAVSDAAGANLRSVTSTDTGNLDVRVEGDAIVVGVARTTVTETMQVHLSVAIGRGERWDDEIPNGRPASLDLASPRPSRGLREIDVERNNFRLSPGFKTLADVRLPRIVRSGDGRQPLILIPGVYSGDGVFDEFIARNRSRYAFYTLTPPGLSGTPARPLPPETVSYGDFTWTKRLANDIHSLITRNKFEKAIVVVHGFPGSLAVEALAAAHPEAVAGIIEVASMPVQFAPSPRDPGRPATAEERVAVFNDAWAAKWFKYVTPETWESNNYPAAMFANDPESAERARRRVEANPLPVKIRYLSEFMASDHSPILMEMGVPMLVLRPGFDKAYLDDPANAFFKNSFQDAWDVFAKNAKITVSTIPNARALMFDDQPALVEQAIARFVDARRP